ncbi:MULTISPECIES: PepSY domain-containing protein [Peptoniphilus]|uniref:PepSY domain-containing protein n=1 Tax=Peptoniphilus TaxID=162289 RepID=UPI0003B845BA|nr:MULTISPECIES: PepSY domain-containing protein [Peptoniphilus]ERT63357.1 peptidase propeptide and YpeB domain protein [Peptoniphilus sp. BV3AC2]MDK8276726.1 PepSY domain-containing protein [Peptoniphilus duerdenii]
MRKLILALAFVFLLTGCQSGQNAKTEDKKNGNVATEQNNNEKENSKTDESNKDDLSESKDNKADATITVSPEEAVKKFNDKYPGVKIDEFSFGKENMTYCYEINGFDDDSEYEFEIDATDGTILKDNKELDNTADKTAINLDFISEIQPLIDKSLSEAGSEYHLDSYSIDFEKTGNFNKLDIELENSKGQDIEFEYNLDTKELIKKDM